jgi:hypothetical protein
VAAVPAPPAAPAPASAEVIELSPFTVNTDRDVGYQAENTLAGSRLNTNLRDTPASVSVFTKEFLERHDIPTAAYRVFEDAAEARKFAEKLRLPVVIKADGLAAGKGVVIAKTQAEAELAKVLSHRSRPKKSAR